MLSEKSTAELAKRPYWTVSRVIASIGASASIGLVSWKILSTTFVIDLTSFAFSDFLSLVLALFSIGLSLVFYLKAAETSNAFYDNTYKFTNNVSEILGRIESGFSERLRHLDEGYSRLGDKFDRIPFNFAKAEQEIAKEEESISKNQKERDDLLDELLEKARVQGAEREEYAKRFRDYEAQLLAAQEEAHILRNKLARAELEVGGSMIPGSRASRGLRWFAEKYPDLIASGDTRLISEMFRSELGQYTRSAIQFMVARGIIDEDGALTERGQAVLRNSVQRIPDDKRPIDAS